MKVTPQEWDRVQNIFSALSAEQKHVFSGVRPREIRWLVAPEEDVRPQYKKRVVETRKKLEALFSQHELQDQVCKELLARLLVLGQTQIFKKFRTVEPVEVEKFSEESLVLNGGDSNLQTKLEGLAATILDDSLMDRIDNTPDDLTDIRLRYGITGAELAGLYLQGIVRDRMNRYEPFRSQEHMRGSTRQKEWQFSENRFSVGVKADKKISDEQRVCEDNILLMEGSTFHVGGVFDGLGCSNNRLNVIWQEFLKESMAKYLGKITETLEADELESCLQKAIRSAQKKMKKIFSELASSVILRRRDIPKTAEKTVAKFDRIRAKLEAQGLDVDEELRWYTLNRSAMTTLEMIVMTPSGKGYLCRVGDGQSVIVNRKTGLVSPIGTRRKNEDHSTAFLGVYHDLESLEVIPFYCDEGDLVLTMTDGPGDTYSSPEDLQHLGRLFLKHSPVKNAMLRFCQDVGKKSQTRKSDDYALVAMQITSTG